MNRLASKGADFAKNYQGSPTPSFSDRDSAESSQPLSDCDTVIQTGVLDPVVFAKHLRGMSLNDLGGRHIRKVNVLRVLKHHVGKRCALEIALRTDHGWHSFVAKFYRKDRSDVFEAMKAIQESGFGSRDEFSISQPVAFLPSIRCLLQEKVDGMAADEILKTADEPRRAAVAERCALWLARFHALAPKTGPISRSQDYVKSKSMQRCWRKISQLDGPFGQKAAQLFHRVEDASAALNDVELRAGHGSYNAAHVYLSKDRTVTIDWDWHDVADPARDVARFLYALRRWALDQLGSIRALDGTAKVFLGTYMAVGVPEAEKNRVFFEAATCLNLAMRHLFEGGASWQEKQDRADVMLDEGFHVLDRETAR
jgi:hypothetical protein